MIEKLIEAQEKNKAKLVAYVKKIDEDMARWASHTSYLAEGPLADKAYTLRQIAQIDKTIANLKEKLK